MMQTNQRLARDAAIMIVLFGLLCVTLGFALGQAFTPRPYDSCMEDEVYAWFGDFPDDVVWRCIPADDLTLN